MQPAIDYAELVQRVTERFKYRYDDDPSLHSRMIGVVFARPNSPIAKTEIIPQLNDWHYRSGDHIDFFFVGYAYPPPAVPGYIEVSIPGRDPWLYSSERFNAFREDIEWFCRINSKSQKLTTTGCTTKRQITHIS